MTYADTGLSRATIYYYRVSAYNSAGSSSVSSTASATTQNLPFSENFDSRTVGVLPPGWSQWDDLNHNGFTVVDRTGANPSTSSPPSGLSSGSDRVCRAWPSIAFPGDILYSIEIQIYTAASTATTGIFFRDPTPAGSAWSGYALLLAHSCGVVSLVRYDAGVQTVLQSVTGTAFTAYGDRLQLTLQGTGPIIKAQVYALSGTKATKYLQPNGSFGTTQAWCLSVNDSTYSGSGYLGVVKTNTLTSDFWDDMAVGAAGSVIPPVVNLTAPSSGATLSGVVTFSATATSASGISHVDFLVDGTVRASVYSSPYNASIDTNSFSNGSHTVAATAYDIGGNFTTTSSISVTVTNANTVTRPTIHWINPNVKIEMDAYSGIPFDATLDDPIVGYTDLCNCTTDVVVNHLRALRPTSGTSPYPIHLTQYNNIGNVYLNILMDLLNYVDVNGTSRENSFYHTGAALAFTAGGKSTTPVRQWWGTFSAPRAVLTPTSTTAPTATPRPTSPTWSARPSTRSIPTASARHISPRVRPTPAAAGPRLRNIARRWTAPARPRPGPR